MVCNYIKDKNSNASLKTHASRNTTEDGFVIAKICISKNCLTKSKG